MRVDETVGLPLLDIDRLERLLWEEFLLFSRQYDSPNHQQDRRALFLSWCAVFLPEIFPPDLVNAMIEFRDYKASFSGSKWVELLRIETAIFALSKDSQYIANHRSRFGSHRWAIRNVILDCLALVVNDLSFHDPVLLEQCEYNFKSAHMGSEESAILLLAAPGDPDVKQDNLDEWISRFHLQPNSLEALLDIRERGYTVNGYFAKLFFWLQKYALIRLGSEYSLPPRPEQLCFDFPGWDHEIRRNRDTKKTLSSDVLWNRLSSHPLGNAFVTFRFLQ